MLGFQIGSEFLETQGTVMQTTLRSPVFNREDGSYSFTITFPATDKNKRLTNYYFRVESSGTDQIDYRVKVFYRSMHLWNAVMRISLATPDTFDAVVGLEKGLFNYDAKNKLLTDLVYDQVFYTREDKSKPDSILRVTDQTYPEAKYAYFPVYNPGLFEGTFFDEFFRLTMERFKKMVKEATALTNTLIYNAPFGYYYRLQAAGWISDYWDPEGNYHSNVDDWNDKVDAYGEITDRYSNWIGDDPTRIYNFYVYFFEWVNQFNLWALLAGSTRLCNEFWSAGWTNFVDIKFLDHIYTPGKHIVPFPYLAGVIKESIEQLGYVHGEDFFNADDELRTLAMVTMNMADTYYGNILPVETPLSFKLNEHLPDITVSDLFKELEGFFNCSVIPKRDGTVDIVKNQDILNGTKVIDWSNDVVIEESSISKSAYKFHMNSENDTFWSERVQPDGIDKYERIPDVYDAAQLPDPWNDIKKINVVCFVVDRDSFYITAFEEQQLVWKEFTRTDFDLQVDDQYSDVSDMSCNLGYLLKQYGFYMGSDSGFFHGQGDSNPNFEFPRCSIRGNNLLHAISFDTVRQPMSLKLMFYRGQMPFTPHAVANAHLMPYGGADDVYLGSPIPGAKYSLRWNGENGMYNRFWRDWVWWLNNRAKYVKAKKMLTAAEILDIDWTAKYNINGVHYFLKEIRVDIGDTIGPAEIDLVRA